MDSEVVCPICGGETAHEMPVSNWGEMRRCTSCELIFANPMTLPESPESLYNQAYQGVFNNPGMKEYRERVTKRQKMKRGNIDPEKMLFWNAYYQAKDWLEKNIAKGSVVLDIGCGIGGWLPTLRNKGFIAVGLDVAKEVVDIRAEEGFEVWHGTIDSLDPNWKHPAVCTSFFVLQHVSNPVGFLGTIRSKFPKATLVIGVWNKYPKPEPISAASLPPRTLAWWGPKALKKALEKAGYRITYFSESLAASELPMPRVVRQLIPRERLPKFLYPLLSLYYTIKPVIFSPLKLLRHFTNKNEANTILAIGEPY